MPKRGTGDIEDTIVRLHVEDLQEYSYQNPIELGTAPTSGSLQLEPNQWGINDGKLYLRNGNTVYEFTPSDTIT